MRVSIGELRLCWGNDQIQEIKHIGWEPVYLSVSSSSTSQGKHLTPNRKQQLRRSGAPIASFAVVQVNTETRGWARSRSDNASLQFTDLHDLRKR